MIDKATLISGATGFVDSLFTILLYVLVIVVVGAAIFLFIQLSSYKHTFVRKEVIKGRKIIKRFKYKETKTKEGVEYIKLMGVKDRVPMPPPESIEIDEKGKKFVEAYYINNEYIYLHDNCDLVPEECRTNIDSDYDSIPKEILNIEDDKEKKAEMDKYLNNCIDLRMKKWVEKNVPLKTFQPFTTNQRSMLVSLLKDAQKWKKKNIFDNLPQMVAIGGLVMILLGLMVFWGDLAQPLLDMKEKQNKEANTLKDISETQLQTMEVLKELKQDIQIVRGQEQGGQKPPPN